MNNFIISDVCSSLTFTFFLAIIGKNLNHREKGSCMHILQGEDT